MLRVIFDLLIIQMFFSAYSYLFQHHQLIKEVNTLASKELPDGFLSLVCSGVRLHPQLGLAFQKLLQNQVLRQEEKKRLEQKLPAVVKHCRS